MRSEVIRGKNMCDFSKHKFRDIRGIGNYEFHLDFLLIQSSYTLTSIVILILLRRTYSQYIETAHPTSNIICMRHISIQSTQHYCDCTVRMLQFYVKLQHE